MPSIQEALQIAVKLQNEGRQNEAESYYQAILKVEPRQPDALHLLGLIALAKNDHERAVELIRAALDVCPSSSIFYGNLGVVFRRAGRIDEAIAAYREAIRLSPETPDNYFNLGKSLTLQGDSKEAEKAFRLSIRLDPKKFSPWLSLMNLYVERKKLEDAIAIGLDGLNHCPRSGQMCMNLGVVHKRLGQTEKTLEYYRKAAELDPENVEALCRLANSLVDRNLLDQAQQWIRRAQLLAPDNMHVITSCGIFESAAGNTEKAVWLFRRSIQLHPEHGAAYVHLGISLRKQGLLSDALKVIDQATRFDAISAEALANKAGILMSLGRLDESEELFLDAIQERDGFRDSHANLLMCLQYSPRATAKTLLDEHVEWNELYAPESVRICTFDMPRDPMKKLRLGFVSGDLGMHPVGFFTVRMFEAMDRQEVDTYVYSDRPGRDAIAARIERCVTRWSDTASLGDDGLYQKIKADEIDILFDLAGHTAANRLMMFAKRAAPMQVTWAGYVGTTGLKEMDYLLADKYHVSPEMEANIRETVLRMPNGYVTYEPPADAPSVGSLPLISNGFVTFAAMCNPAKVNPIVLEVWSRILSRLPNSRLLLFYTGWTDPENQRRVRDALGPQIRADRIEFGHCAGPIETLKCYNRVDIALDTFPYSGGLTTCEAMWMGVPTVTMPGDRFASRHSMSHLSNVGLTEFVGKDSAEYVEIAVNLANASDRLSFIRRGLRDQMLSSPLCDGSLFAKEFLDLMRAAWIGHCRL
jgi:protein O-GlcNAc transferase